MKKTHENKTLIIIANNHIELLIILKEKQPNIYLLEKLPVHKNTSCPSPHQIKSKQKKDVNQHLAKSLRSKDRKPRGQSSKAPGRQSDNTDCGKLYKTQGQGYLSNNYMRDEEWTRNVCTVEQDSSVNPL